MAKAFRTTSSEALCVLTGTTSFFVKIEETVKKYSIRKEGGRTQPIDRELERTNWPHPADVVKITEATEYNGHTIQVFTDGRKKEYGYNQEWQSTLKTISYYVGRSSCKVS